MLGLTSAALHSPRTETVVALPIHTVTRVATDIAGFRHQNFSRAIASWTSQVFDSFCLRVPRVRMTRLPVDQIGVRRCEFHELLPQGGLPDARQQRVESSAIVGDMASTTHIDDAKLANSGHI